MVYLFTKPKTKASGKRISDEIKHAFNRHTHTCSRRGNSEWKIQNNTELLRTKQRTLAISILKGDAIKAEKHIHQMLNASW